MSAGHQGNVAFPRGSTHYNGQTIDTNDYGNSVSLEGVVHIFPNNDPSVTALSARRDGGTVTAICVRNVSGIALLPGRIPVWKSGYEGRRVDGYVTTEAAQAAGVVDDQLPSAGVPNGDLFWLIVKGKVLVKTGLTGASDALTISVGNKVVAATAATSQATTAGRMKVADFTGATAVLAGQINNAIGRALTARTTNNTDTNTLVELDLY